MSTTGRARGQRPANATISDVASHAGVSPSTASRAFNHPHLLLEDTVARVKASADALGFRHNRYAKALSTGRSTALGLIVPDLSNPFFPPLVHAAQLAAEEKGYSLYILSSEHSAAREQQLAALVSRDVAGLILASPRMSRTHVRSLAEEVPTVLINAQVLGISTVLVSAAQAITDAIQHCADRGISGVAYVGSEERWWPNTEREDSVRQEASNRSLSYRHLRITNPTYEDAREVILNMEPRQNELIVAFDDIIAHGVLDGMRQRGLQTPTDFSVLGCDDALPISTQPRLSTIHLDTRTAARTAIDMLLSSEPKANANRVIVSGTFLPGETT